MKITIRILSIAAVALAVLGLLLCGCVVLFQTPLCRLLKYPPELPFAFPVASILECVRVVLFAGGVCLAVNIPKIGIWAEILLLSHLPLCPIISRLFAIIQPILLRNRGGNYIAAHSVVNELCSWPLIILGFGSSLCLLVCGMSIAYKVMNKKLSRRKLAQ